VIDLAIYNGKRVLVTGHTGFKGTWLVKSLENLGAQVTGFSLPDDIRSRIALRSCVARTKPEFVFHLAAQAFVPVGFKDPIETFETNTLGTANLLEALRIADRPCTCIIVTTDKCYARGGFEAHGEADPLGGHCPYSASKAAAEHVVTAYRDGFFAPEHRIQVATARAGNVIGGGDWGEGRLVPNAIRALLAGKPVPVFNPGAVRPWQYVEDVIDGYLRLGAALAQDLAFLGSWNFGPIEHHSVMEVVTAIINEWGSGMWDLVKTDLREIDHLRIDSFDARSRLLWDPKYDFDRMIKTTVAWYKEKGWI